MAAKPNPEVLIWEMKNRASAVKRKRAWVT